MRRPGFLAFPAVARANLPAKGTMYTLSKSRAAAISCAILLPPVYFYFLLSRSLSRLPFLDDYTSVLQFLLQWKQEHGVQHLVQILTSQHNEYRLMFENVFFGLQYALLGHTDLRALAMLGDLFVIPIFAVLSFIWRQGGTAREQLVWFVPVSWILFQLQYASSLNSAMAPLQNLPVVFFALLCCSMAARPGWWTFAGAVASLALCIGSSGNGLFLLPVVGLLFLQQRRYRHFALWLLAGIAFCLIYFHGYNFGASQSHADKSLLSSFKHLSPAYGLAFLGSIAAKANPLPAIAFGALLVAMFLVATWQRLFRQNPALYYSALFFFVTAFAVSGLRSDLGLVSALGSRYRINSTVLVILIYFYLVQQFKPERWRPFVQAPLAILLGLALIGFDLLSDQGGQKFLLTRRQKLETAMLRWERHEPREDAAATTPGDYTAENEKKGFYEPIEPLLSEAIEAGIYRLPALPEQH